MTLPVFLRFLFSYLFLAMLLCGVAYLVEENYYFRDHRSFQMPLANATAFRIREDPLGRGDFGAPRAGRRRHLGIDLLASPGDPVVAVRSGIAEVGHQEGMGTFVKVMHPDGLQTIYGHLSETYVAGRRRVRQGEVIGAVGKSGNASHRSILPHLHFEVRDGKKALDPTPLIQDECQVPFFHGRSGVPGLLQEGGGKEGP